MKKVFEQPAVALESLQVEENLMNDASLVTANWDWSVKDE